MTVVSVEELGEGDAGMGLADVCPIRRRAGVYQLRYTLILDIH